jgi:hypothetical protein
VQRMETVGTVVDGHHVGVGGVQGEGVPMSVPPAAGREGRQADGDDLKAPELIRFLVV